MTKIYSPCLKKFCSSEPVCCSGRYRIILLTRQIARAFSMEESWLSNPLLRGIQMLLESRTECIHFQFGVWKTGVSVDHHIICSAIHRVLSANHQWNELLAAAANESLQIVISNTTEVGIQLVQESIFQNPPASFPAKLLAFLYERYVIFKGAPGSGMLIIPTELLTDNGKKLKSILTGSGGIQSS